MKATDLIKALKAEVQRTGLDFEIYTVDPGSGQCMLQLAKYHSDEYYIEPTFYSSEVGEIIATDAEDEDVHRGM